MLSVGQLEMQHTKEKINFVVFTCRACRLAVLLGKIFLLEKYNAFSI
jgi:hypothetical protein